MNKKKALLGLTGAKKFFYCIQEIGVSCLLTSSYYDYEKAIVETNI